MRSVCVSAATQEHLPLEQTSSYPPTDDTYENLTVSEMHRASPVNCRPSSSVGRALIFLDDRQREPGSSGLGHSHLLLAEMATCWWHWSSWFFKLISSKIAEIWHKICQKQALFTSFRDSTVIFLILFFGRFWRFKRCVGSFSRSLRKSDLKTCIALLNHEMFCLTFFYLVTWDDLDPYYGHKAQ